MNSLKRLFTFAFLILTSLSFASAMPQMLIVRINEKAKGEEASDSITQMLAQEMDNEGKVFPIAYGLTDPYFRAAVTDGILKNPPDHPSLATALEIAGKLKTEFVLVTYVTPENGQFRAKAVLYRKSKDVWHDPDPNSKEARNALQNYNSALKVAKKNGVQIQDAPITDERVISTSITNVGDSENALLSLARTWSILLVDGPLKQLPGQPRQARVPEVKVQTKEPDVIPVAPIVKPKMDNQNLMAEVMKLLNAKQFSQAIALLHDAVDEAPGDVDRRRALVLALMQSGDDLNAAKEARRSAPVVASPSEFRVLAARAWLSAGNAVEAQVDLKEAVALEPDSPEVRRLIGDINLATGQYPAAVSNYDFLISKAASKDAYIERAIAKLGLDDYDGCDKDLEVLTAGKPGELLLPEMTVYGTCISAMDHIVDDTGNRMRSLLQRARVKSSDPEVATELQVLGKRVAKLTSLSALVPTPAAFARSQATRVLALNLLVQALSDIESFCKTNEEDTLGDATINLGEGLKQWAAAKKALETERSKS